MLGLKLSVAVCWANPWHPSSKRIQISAVFIVIQLFVVKKIYIFLRTISA